MVRNKISKVAYYYGKLFFQIIITFMTDYDNIY